MKKKISVEVNGKKISAEIEIRNKDHFLSQLKFKNNIKRNRRKYSRKKKHKNRDE